MKEGWRCDGGTTLEYVEPLEIDDTRREGENCEAPYFETELDREVREEGKDVYS